MDPLIRIGEPAPQLDLYDLKGVRHTLDAMHGSIVVVNFWSAACDWCERVDREMVPFIARWNKRVKLWWIASNANEPRELIEQVASSRQLPAVLPDRDQAVADLYSAQTTPHFFIVDSEGILRYQGAWDDITFRQRAATHKYVPDAVEALLEDRVPEFTQTIPYGCMLVRYGEAAG